MIEITEEMITVGVKALAIHKAKPYERGRVLKARGLSVFGSNNGHLAMMPAYPNGHGVSFVGSFALSEGASMRRRRLMGMAGGAVAWSAAARAQQAPAAGPTIGLLSSQNFPDWMTMAVRKGLDETGYVEGRNLTILYRAAEGQTDRLPAIAAELVNSRVSVLFATGGPLPARAAKAATTTVPIVFAYGGDPVADRLVASIGRPEANVTGATFIGASLTAKRLEMLREFIPRATDVALLVNPSNTLAKSQGEDAAAAAKTLGLRLHVINASSASEVDEAFATMGRLKVDLAVVSVDPTFGITLRDQITALALRYRIPTAGELPEVRNAALAGILFYYGPSLPDTWRQAGGYVGRILKGAKPSDLPILQPTRFELVINLKTVKALGLEVPPRLLAIAVEVVE